VFTGSTALGRKVMAAAAPNSTPLTLELGGKSPAIVTADYPPAKAAARIATGKWFNAGQTCIAPDYAFVPEAVLAALRCAARGSGRALPAVRRAGRRLHPHRQRGPVPAPARAARRRPRPWRQALPLADIAARAERERLLAPTLVLDAPDEARILREEIFGRCCR
jgi:coniferyl-aldehyde dehydrogenase